MANGLGPIGNLLGKVDSNGALVVSLSGSFTGQLLGEVSATVPAYSFAGDTNTGYGATAADTLGLFAGGATARVTVTSTAVTSTVPYRSAAATDLDLQPGTSGGTVIKTPDGTTRWSFNTSGNIVGVDGQTFGWSDVSLSRGAADRLDLADGDSFRIVNGAIILGTVDASGVSLRRSGTQMYSASGNDAAYSDFIAQAFFLNGGNGPRWTSGGGSPEGAVTAAVGSMYSRTDGGAGTSLYVKESGAGNTGWVAK